MTKLYKFTAENISRRTTTEFVHKLEDEGVEVEAAAMDPIFENQCILIVSCDWVAAKKLRDRIWKLNQGLCCDMAVITADGLEEYL